MPFADYGYEYELEDEIIIDDEAAQLYQQGLEAAAGIDCEIDMVAAHCWFNLAASKGHDGAIEQRHEMAELMSSDEVRQALTKARAWLKAQAN